MGAEVTVVMVLSALLVGGVVGWLSGRRVAEEERLAARTEVATLKATLQTREEVFDNQLSAAVLEVSQQVGTGLAERNAEDADARLASQRLVLESALDGVSKELQELKTKLEGVASDSSTNHAALSGHIAQLATGIPRLTSALQGGATRGKWGEFQLERIVEVAGLTEHVTWQKQAQFGSGKGALRPDLLVYIPEGGVLVVDAKAPELDLDAAPESDAADDDRAKALKKHIKDLGARNYPGNIPGAVGNVFMFIPSESAYAAALRADPGLLADAAKHRVSVVSPSTLLNALMVVAGVWRQYEANEHIADALADASTLHERLTVFVSHLTGVAKGLNSASEAFTSAMASFDSRLMPAVRKLEAADLTKSDATLELPEVESHGLRQWLDATDARASVEAGDPVAGSLSGPTSNAAG